MGNFLSRLGLLFGTRIHDQRTDSIPPHHKCRNCGRPCDRSSSENSCSNAKYTRTGTKDQPAVIRSVVPNDKVRWSSAFKYHPLEFTSEKVRTSTKVYTDRDPREQANVNIPWNANDTLCDRRSYHGKYEIVGRVPQNPCGRTGITGRGHLGHFGPNHAADPIVTRWKRGESGEKVLHPKSHKPILQFVCIRRRDTGEFAIPGGMVDRKERITETLQREFIEEALNLPESDQTKKEQIISTIKGIFESGGTAVYCGYVDDPRNTDNAWMETTAFNFHDEKHENLALLHVRAGDDATYAFWHDLESQMPLFASHANFLEQVANLHQADW